MRKICVVTGTRAEFGLLRPLMQLVKDDEQLNLQIIATGMHLSSEFGCTINEIIKSGFEVDKQLECILSSDSSVGVSKSIGLAMIGFADAYRDLMPDLVVVLGDRTEILAAVIAAAMANIPIAHIHGGETTEGAYDEAIRHSITKFSHLHFTATEVYRKRVIQLGEQPERVYNVGAIGLDSIKNLRLMTRQEFEASIDFVLAKRNVLVTYHPVTLETENPREVFQNVLNVLDELEETNVIFTHANSDKNGRVINEMIGQYVKKNKHKAAGFASLGQLRYLSALQYVDFVIGNSSSGIIEVPSFNIPTINIGDRQKGRIAPESVLHCEGDLQSLQQAVQQVISPKFKSRIQQQKQIFGIGNTAEKIVQVIKNNERIDLKKSFYNIDFK